MLYVAYCSIRCMLHIDRLTVIQFSGKQFLVRNTSAQTEYSCFPQSVILNIARRVN